MSFLSELLARPDTGFPVEQIFSTAFHKVPVPMWKPSDMQNKTQP
jgi:hypothetical protein